MGRIQVRLGPQRLEEATAVSRIKLGTFRRTVLTKAQVVVLEVVGMVPLWAKQESTTPVEQEPICKATKVETQVARIPEVAVVVPEERVKPRHRAVAVETVFRV
jgi:hypothetical protein